MFLKMPLKLYFMKSYEIKVSRCILAQSHKKQIVWKQGLNWSFYALILRTKLSQNSFFFTWHQNVNKPRSRAARTVYGLIFLLFYKIIVSFFSFLCQDANKTRPNCAIIGCNLSKKHKLTLYKAQNRESNYVDHEFFFNFYQELPTCTKPWGQTFKHYRAAQLFGLCLV